MRLTALKLVTGFNSLEFPKFQEVNPPLVQQGEFKLQGCEFAVKCVELRIEKNIGSEVVYYKFQFRIQPRPDEPRAPDHTSYEIERRYSHFEWLYQKLEEKYPGIVLPSLPQKEVNYHKEKRKYHLEIVLKKLNYYFAEVAGEYEMNFFVHFMQETNLLEFEKFYKGNPPEKKKGIVQNLLGTGAKYFSKAAGFLQIQNDTKVKKRVQDPFDLQFTTKLADLDQMKKTYDSLYLDMKLMAEREAARTEALEGFKKTLESNVKEQREVNQLRMVDDLLQTQKLLKVKLEKARLQIRINRKDLNMFRERFQELQEQKDQFQRDCESKALFGEYKSKAFLEIQKFQQHICDSMYKCVLLQQTELTYLLVSTQQALREHKETIKLMQSTLVLQPKPSLR